MAPLVDAAPLTLLACCGNKSRKCYRKKFTEHSLTFCAYEKHSRTGFPVNPVTIHVGSIVNYAVNISTSNAQGTLTSLVSRSNWYVLLSRTHVTTVSCEKIQTFSQKLNAVNHFFRGNLLQIYLFRFRKRIYTSIIKTSYIRFLASFEI